MFFLVVVSVRFPRACAWLWERAWLPARAHSLRVVCCRVRCLCGGLGLGASTYLARRWQVIVMSTVRASSSGGVGFLADWRRVNVAFTRPRRGLVVLGHPDTLSRDHATWGRWLHWVSAHGVNIRDPVPRGHLDRAALQAAAPSANILPQGVTPSELSEIGGADPSGARSQASAAASMHAKYGAGAHAGGMGGPAASAAAGQPPPGPPGGASYYQQQYQAQWHAHSSASLPAAAAASYPQYSYPASQPHAYASGSNGLGNGQGIGAQGDTMAALMRGDFDSLMASTSAGGAAPLPPARAAAAAMHHAATAPAASAPGYPHPRAASASAAPQQAGPAHQQPGYPQHPAAYAQHPAAYAQPQPPYRAYDACPHPPFPLPPTDPPPPPSAPPPLVPAAHTYPSARQPAPPPPLPTASPAPPASAASAGAAGAQASGVREGKRKSRWDTAEVRPDLLFGYSRPR